MKIAIVGAGFTGLSAGYYLSSSGHDVTIFERDPFPGGLALGFKEKKWEWELEKHYHHWFTNDKPILNLAKELGYKVTVSRPKTSVYVDGKIFQFDSPLHVLQFPKLPFASRVQMAVVLGFLRYNPFWRPLEKVKAVDFLPRTMGEAAYKKLWEPLFIHKFGNRMNEISLAWFWARIHKRTPALAYPEGGFLKFANKLASVIEDRKGKIFFNAEVSGIDKNGKVNVIIKSKPKSLQFDKVIVTLPSFLFLKIVKGLPEEYRDKLSKLEGFGAINLVMRLRKPFLEDGTYWLNVCDKKSPMMAIVEHTNLMDKKHYNNEHVVYVANYFPKGHPYFKLKPEELLKKYHPYLQRINKEYRKNLIGYNVFQAPFAQPMIPLNYSKIIPDVKTPFKNLFLSNIQQVYPWDRGTNYSVEQGEKVAGMIS